MKTAIKLALLSTFLFGVVHSYAQEKTFESALYPLQVGATWTYKVTEKNAKDEQRVTVKVEKMEILEADGKKVSVARLEIRSGDRKLSEQVGVLADGVYRFSSADKNITPALCFLKLGVEKGKNWQVDSTTDGAKIKGSFSIGKDMVSVPYFKDQKRETITSACTDLQVGSSKMSVTYWFADKVGVVKQHVVVGNFDQTLELVEYQPGMTGKK